jgi:hypothetical protein
MSNPARIAALAIAALGLVLTTACKTVRTVTHVESISPTQSNPFLKGVYSKTDKWSDQTRFMKSPEQVEKMSKRERRKYEKTLAGMRKETTNSMDQARINTTDLFGGTRDNKQFGGNQAENKRFAGNTMFRGNKQYEPNRYQFLSDREMARKEALAASETFGDRNKVAGEAKRGWFGRDKRFGSKSANEAGENYSTNTLRETEGTARQHDETPLPIVDPPGRNGSGLSLSDLREMLGRGEGTETIHVPPKFR